MRQREYYIIYRSAYFGMYLAGIDCEYQYISFYKKLNYIKKLNSKWKYLRDTVTLAVDTLSVSTVDRGAF